MQNALTVEILPQDIAPQPHLSRFTVNADLKSIDRMLNVSSRAQAERAALQRGLVQA